jgi:uncharacterized protein with NAD-binding domain and iron-sulfur cluster
LQEHLKTFELNHKTSISDLEFSGIISLLRTVLESQDSKDQYSIFKVYCNWALHSALDHKFAKDIITMLNRSLRENYSLEAGGLFAKEINRAFSLKQLRFQMQKFLSEQGFSTVLTENDANWRSTRSGWLRQLLGRKIQAPNKISGDLNTEIEHMKKLSNSWLRSIEVVVQEENRAMFRIEHCGAKNLSIFVPIEEM